MTRRVLEVEYVNRNCAEFAGFGSRDLHVEVVGRPPVWATRSRRWVTSPHRMDDIVALAESRGWEVRETKTVPSAEVRP